MVIAAHIHRLALGCDQFGVDLCLVIRKRSGKPGETRLDFQIFRLCGQRLCPIQGEIEMAAPVVDFTYLAGRGFVVFQNSAVGLIQRFSQYLSLCVVIFLAKMLQRRAQRQKLSE